MSVNSIPSTRRASDDLSDARPPPVKRARKAMNCEPCRHSKLKCDRKKPCSSCVLRGTTTMCYQGHDQSLHHEVRRVDPIKEFSRIRSSLASLEKHYLSGKSHAKNDDTTLSSSFLKQEPHDNEGPSTVSAPGMLGLQGQGGLYSGPTSAASHLATDEASSLGPVENSRPEPSFHAYDNDLIGLLPPIHVMDNLIGYYFGYCNWIHRYVNQTTYLPAWDRFKAGESPDRLVLATACVIVALAIRYIPVGHELLFCFPQEPTDAAFFELSWQYYDVMKKVLRRYQDEIKTYSLELVELLLARCHFLAYSRANGEEVWSIRGELMTIATAMGLHRDPGNSRYAEDVAERRRWTWWNLHLVDRWQSFMHGRPLSIPAHHFNTKLPSPRVAGIDPHGRILFYNISLFKLSFILGELLDDAVSLRAISYESTLGKDRLLTDWLKSLPEELSPDEDRILRNVSSRATAARRLGVQTLTLMSTYYHMRFTLHRPHVRHTSDSSDRSLDIAVTCAEKLISLAVMTGPEVVDFNTGVDARSTQSVYRHLNWRPLHVFSAAMFFTFQLARCPDSPDASRYKSCISKSLRVLHAERAHDPEAAEKALKVLLTLAPLYSDEYLSRDAQGRQQEKAAILATVNTLAFPYMHPPTDLYMRTTLPSVPHPSPSATSSYGPAPARPVAEAGDKPYPSPPRSYMAVSSMRTHSATPASSQQQQPQPQPQQQMTYGVGPPSPAKKVSPKPSGGDIWGGAVGFPESEWLTFMYSLQPVGTS